MSPQELQLRAAEAGRWLSGDEQLDQGSVLSIHIVVHNHDCSSRKPNNPLLPSEGTRLHVVHLDVYRQHLHT